MKLRRTDVEDACRVIAAWIACAASALAQNLLNRSIDAGLTPILTLAAPRPVQAGLRYNLAIDLARFGCRETSE